MKIEPFCRDDVERFLDLAAAEGWVAEAWEFEFLLTVFPEGCFCLRDRSGAGIAFVTSVMHERSGWIGNLVVAERERGRGIGRALFGTAHAALQAAGAETIWLTASNSGRHLYEKCGFTGIDTIVRWTGSGRRIHMDHVCHAGSGEYAPPVCSIDARAWGDRRDGLLRAVTGRGRLLMEATGFAVSQPCGSAVQIGPFAALENVTAERIFDQALEAVPQGTKVYIDAPASNRTATRIFGRRTMQVSGSNELMYAGKKPAYAPELLYGLASMGSMG